ncbi:MAG TPA: PfkB family carbohydrate kinase [Chthoniobacterales bacterium]
MDPARLQTLLNQFASKRILVIGDVMLDEFIWGRVARISPEAPVPVVEVTGESFYPGGAANVARNLKEFCDDARVMGLIGTGGNSGRLRKLLEDLGINVSSLIQEENFRTIVKTRIIARQQQVVRVDRESRIPLTKERVNAALTALKVALPEIDAVIFEDYAKGFLTDDFIEPATELINAAGLVVTADPNPKNRVSWQNLTAIKPNRTEAFQAAGIPESDPTDRPLEDDAFLEVGAKLLEKWGARFLLITLGEHGMVLFDRDNPPYHIPTRAREVYDVSGAGDTAIALFTLALSAGATAREAADISNHAASVVVGKLGTATLSPQELIASFANHAR